MHVLRSIFRWGRETPADDTVWPFTVAEGYAVNILKTIRDEVNKGRSTCRQSTSSTMEFERTEVCKTNVHRHTCRHVYTHMLVMPVGGDADGFPYQGPSQWSSR